MAMSLTEFMDHEPDYAAVDDPRERRFATLLEEANSYCDELLSVLSNIQDIHDSREVAAAKGLAYSIMELLEKEELV